MLFWLILIQDNKSMKILIWLHVHIFFVLLLFDLSSHEDALLELCLNIAPKHFFQGGSPWANLFPNSMIVLWVLYCVHFFSAVKIFRCSFLLSFSYSFCFFLVPLFWKPLQCLSSQNIWCLIKTPFKHEQTWSAIVPVVPHKAVAEVSE